MYLKKSYQYELLRYLNSEAAARLLLFFKLFTKIEIILKHNRVILVNTYISTYYYMRCLNIYI